MSERDKEEPKRVGDYAYFDGMSWPGHWDIGEHEWRLRHAPETITRSDHMQAASVMAAYRELIVCPETKRRQVVKELRKLAPKLEADS